MFEIIDLSVTLGKKMILENINLHLKEKKITVLLGKNGSGKSTLVNCLNQQIPYNGKILFNKQDLKEMKIRERAKHISVLPQTLSCPHISVKELVSMGRSPYLDLTQKLREEDQRRIENAIKKIGIEELSERALDQLSGGERQKSFLSMILAQDTEMVILDEPTTYMDMIYEAEFLNLLIKLRDEENKTIFVVMHNLNEAIHVADELVILDEGHVYFEGSIKEALDNEILEKVFSVQRYEMENRIFFAAKG